MSNYDSKYFDQPPPWVKYLNSEPTSYNQGDSEEWLLQIWLPFWKQLSLEEQGIYLIQYPPPNDDWYLYLTHYWK